MEAGKVMGLAPYGEYIEGQYLASSNENAAATIQKDWEDRAVELVKIASKKCSNIVLTGGCFLNVVVNYKLLKEFPDLNFYVDPISFDGGTAIGAAYILHNNPKIKSY
jgi:carbamoyltransferase